MSLVSDMLSEERHRLLQTVKFYHKKINEFPKGAIVKKTIYNKSYGYLNYRQNEKHHSDYIGLYGSDKIKELKDKIKERKKYESLLKKTEENLKEVQRYIDAGKSRKRKV